MAEHRRLHGRLHPIIERSVESKSEERVRRKLRHHQIPFVRCYERRPNWEICVFLRRRWAEGTIGLTSSASVLFGVIGRRWIIELKHICPGGREGQDGKLDAA